MIGSWFQNLQDNLNINKESIHKFAHLLYSSMNRSCFGHPLCIKSEPSSQDCLLRADLSWHHHVHNRVYSLNMNPDIRAGIKIHRYMKENLPQSTGCILVKKPDVEITKSRQNTNGQLYCENCEN